MKVISTTFIHSKGIFYANMLLLLCPLQILSQGPKNNEIEFEFLGNFSGNPYIMHTNVCAQSLGNHEQ